MELPSSKISQDHIDSAEKSWTIFLAGAQSHTKTVREAFKTACKAFNEWHEAAWAYGYYREGSFDTYAQTLVAVITAIENYTTVRNEKHDCHLSRRRGDSLSSNLTDMRELQLDDNKRLIRKTTDVAKALSDFRNATKDVAAWGCQIQILKDQDAEMIAGLVNQKIRHETFPTSRPGPT